MAKSGASKASAAIALLLFAAFFIGESCYSYTQKSATSDEPVHVADGYFSLAYGDYRFDPEHPPLLRMWAALPLLFDNVTADTRVMDTTLPDRWAIVDLFNDAYRFLYKQNDADRLLYQARFMIVLLGVLLGVLMFAWVNEWLGFVPACAALAMLALEPNIVAHFSLVTTDAGLTTFAFGAIYFAWRVCRQQTRWNVAGLCLFCALSVASKYSSALLYPAVIVLLGLSAYPFRRLSVQAAATTVAMVLITSYLGLWASYGFHYTPSADASWIYSLHDNPYVAERVPGLTQIVRIVDRFHLLPNVFSEGFLLGQAKSQSRFAFLAGQFSETGWWYYFPFAIAIKTPIALLVLALAGVVIAVGQRRREPLPLWFLVVPIAFFLAGPMQSNLNIGLRHVLTIYPFLIMLAALAVSRLFAGSIRYGQWVAGALALLWVLEYGRVYPHPLAFFNTFVGGPSQGAKYLVDSNLDWGQDLKTLKHWMDERGVAEINLSYFGAADPAYYGIKAVYLNGSPGFVPPEQLSVPKLPGYVAISESNLSGVFLDERRRAYYRPLQSMTPVATLGYSIKVFWVERAW